MRVKYAVAGAGLVEDLVTRHTWRETRAMRATSRVKEKFLESGSRFWFRIGPRRGCMPCTLLQPRSYVEVSCMGE